MSSSSHIISQANEWRVLHPVYRGYEERLESQDQSGFRIDFIYFIKSQKVLFFFFLHPQLDNLSTIENRLHRATWQ